MCAKYNPFSIPPHPIQKDKTCSCQKNSMHPILLAPPRQKESYMTFHEIFTGVIYIQSELDVYLWGRQVKCLQNIP